MLGIAPWQVVIRGEIKEYWLLGNVKRVARNSTWRLLRKDRWAEDKSCLSVDYSWEEEGIDYLLIASEASQHKCCFLYPSWNFKISLAQEWALAFGWTMVVPRVVSQHRVSRLSPVLTEMEDQSLHHETRAKPEQIWCPSMHACEAKAPAYPKIWADAPGLEEHSFFILCKNNIFNPISKHFSSTFAVQAKGLSDPALFPQLLWCSSLLELLAVAAGLGQGWSSGSHQVHHRGMMLGLAEERGGEWHGGSCLEDVQTAAGEWS